MANKFSKKVFASAGDAGVQKEEKPFERDTGDNPIFKEIQVDDISKYINEDTVGVVDFDTSIYECCSNMETKSILCVNEKEGIEIEHQGIREFRGQTKKISENSWLGLENTKRELEGLPVLLEEDFVITPQQRLKFPLEKALEQAKIAIYGKLKAIRLQYGIGTLLPIIGSGDNFRHKLPLCRPYKGNRTETLRPIILKEIRQWCIDTLKAEDVQPRNDGENIEADDRSEMYATKGYLDYRKTGIFSFVAIASDKDSGALPKMWINPDKHTGKDNPLRGKWKYPQPMLIEGTDKGVGKLELKITGNKKEIKGYGLKWLIYQAILGIDSADNYSCIKHLGRKFNYGDISAYEDLLDKSTPTEVIQKAVDVMAGLLPYGVEYTDHTGKDWDVDTMTYCDVYFKVAYMLRSPSDTMDFYKLCKAFKVDTSKIVNNNTMTPPVRTFNKDKAEELVDDMKVVWDNVLPSLKGYKTLKKGDLVLKMEEIISNVTNFGRYFEDFYEMKSLPKEIKEEKL